MLSWLSWFFDDLFYWIAVFALAGGAIAYLLSYFVGFIPMLKSHAMILKVVGLVLVIGGGYYVADHNGYQRRVVEDKVEIDRLNGEARAKEEELKVKVKNLNSSLQKAKNEINSNKATKYADADAGRMRLCPSSGVQTDPSSSSGNTTNESDSERQTVKALIDIASEGDTAIVSLNSCIAQYNQVMQTVNEGVK
jgi:hypothetical protein